jgi:carbon-monoxide dehydrogenase large subunit
MAISPGISPRERERLRWIGERAERLEDERLLRGLGRFVDDVDPPRLLHMAVVRSPFPRARIVSIDATRAQELEGVKAVLLGEEVERRTEPISVVRPVPDAVPLRYFALAVGEALYEGHPVATVVATDRYVAEDAIDLIEIEYEPLPHVVDVDSALAPDAPVLHPELGSNLLVANPRGMGDVDAALAEADVVVADTFRINRVTGLPMETRGVTADFSAGLGQLTVRSSTQTPHLSRRQLSESLRFPEADIRVVANDVGGGFGLKIGLFPEEILACLHAIDLGRPIKWVEDRVEHFRASTHAREAVHRIQLGGRLDGTLTGIKNVYSVDLGAYNSPTGSPMLSSLLVQGPYRITDAYVERRVVITNKTPTGAYRGYGQPESNFVRETLVDRYAREIGMDPVDVRRQNFVRPDDMPWSAPGGARYDSGDYEACLDLALERIDYAGVRARQAALRAEGRLVGVGVSCYVEMTGYPGSKFLGKHGALFGAHESVVMRANRSGGLDLYTGVSPFGQGTETAYAQIAASVVGLHPTMVRVHAGDTYATPYNTGAFASRTLIAGTGAIERAASEVRQKALRIAAFLLDVPAERLEVEDGHVRSVDDPRVGISFAEVSLEASLGHRLPEGEPPGLEATAYFDPTASAFAFGSAAAVVEVNHQTGEFAIERLVFVHDCGPQVNPMLVEGQLHGGVAQALGAALFEELVYDPDTGQLVNGTMLDYFMPTAADLPPLELAHTETPSPVTPLGVRGVGESGTIPPAAAIANALYDALAPYGVVINKLPLTPQYVWQLIREAESRP